MAAIYQEKEGTVGGSMYYIHKDNLGSVEKITDGNGNLFKSYSYDAWGKRRDPDNWLNTSVTDNDILFSRGYTGHEHYDLLGLMNMNGRMYDPALGRFLSPDPFMQDPSNTQNFNRYSYCLNNPLKFIDPSGFQYSGSTFHQPSSTVCGGNQLSFSPRLSSFRSAWDNDWGDLMASGIDLSWISFIGSSEPGARGSNFGSGAIGENGVPSNLREINTSHSPMYVDYSSTGGLYIPTYGYIRIGLVNCTDRIDALGGWGDGGEDIWEKVQTGVRKINFTWKNRKPSNTDNVDNSGNCSLRDHYRYEMKHNSFFSTTGFNAFLNYYLDLSNVEDKFVAKAEKPCEIIGQAIANLTPVAYVWNVVEGFKSGKNLWGDPINHIDVGGYSITGINYVLMIIPGGDKYGNIIDLGTWGSDIINSSLIK